MHIVDVMSVSIPRIASNDPNSCCGVALQLEMRSILLIDDDADIRMTLRDFLTELKFVVHTARNGQHAVQLLEKIEPPGLILLDYKIPVMDGNLSDSIMRRIPHRLMVPVVILAAAPREWSGSELTVEEVLS